MPLDSIPVLSILERITDANGDPVPGGTIEFYDAGTSTPKTVYADADLTVSLGTSVEADSGGYPISGGTTKTMIYVGTASYKAVVKDADGVTLITHDDLPGAAVTATASDVALPETPVVSRTSTYTILTTDQAKLINADPTGGSFAITLPSAVTVGDGWRVGVRHSAISSNAVTVRTTGAQTIGMPGQTAATSMSLTGLGHARWFVSDGAGWTVDSEVPPIMGGPLPYIKVADRLTAPPASPTGGARYIINGSPTGAWSTLSFAENQVVESDGNGSWLGYTPANGWMAWVDDEDLVTVYHDSAWEDWSNVTAPTSSTLQHAVFQHQETNGTVGGTPTTAAWTKRGLNTETVNTITGVSLSSGQITLPVGTYLINFRQEFYRPSEVQSRIKVISGTASPDPILSGWALWYGLDGASDAPSMHGASPTGFGVLTVTATAVIELQYWVAANFGGTSGLGAVSTEPTGSPEVYARVAILSLAAQQGPTGAAGPQGEGGLDAAHPYQFDTGTTAADPGTGRIRLNNSTIASATRAYISDTNSAAGSMTNVLNSWGSSTSTTKGRLKYSKEGSAGTFHEFLVTSVTDSGSYFTLNLTYVNNSGTFVNGDDLALLWVDKGDKGDPGDPAGSAATIGKPTTPTTGTGTTSAGFSFVFADALAASGYVTGLRVWANNAGTIELKRFSKSGDVFTQVGPDYPVTLAAGLNTIDASVLGPIPVRAGERLGWHQLTAVVAFSVGGTGYSGGYYEFAGRDSMARLVDASVSPTTQLQIGIDLIGGIVEDLVSRHYVTDTALAGTVQTIGRKETPVTGTAGGLFTFVFANPVSASGAISKIRAFGLGEGAIAVKRFTRSGDVFTQVGPDYPVQIGLGAVEMTPAEFGKIAVNAGEYLGFYPTSASLPFVFTGTGSPYYNPASAGNFRAFTDAAVATPSLQVGFDIAAGHHGDVPSRVDIAEAGAPLLGDEIVEATFSNDLLTWSASVVLLRNRRRITVTGSGSFSAVTASKFRYDVLYLDADALTLGVAAGTERTWDASAFIPAMTDSKRLPVWLVRQSSTAGAITLTPVWQVRDGIIKPVRAEVEAMLARARRRLPATLAKVRRGTALHMVGFGDSITALASDGPNALIANGTRRDRAAASGTVYTYLRDSYETDIVDALPLYTSVQLGRADDGGGTIHTRVGWNWELVAALEAIGYTLGTDLTYDNWGYPGYASDNAVVAGVPEPWLVNAAASGADFAVVALGMNERGASTTEADLAVVVTTLQTAGMEVLLLDVPRPRVGVVADWRYTNRVIARVADYTGAAHLSFAHLTDETTIAGLGLDLADVAQANRTNHPGLTELAAYGRELVRLVVA